MADEVAEVAEARAEAVAAAREAEKVEREALARDMAVYEAQKAAVLKRFVGKRLGLSEDERAKALKSFDAIRQTTAQLHDAIRRKVLARAGVPAELLGAVSINMHTDENGVPIAVEVIDRAAVEEKVKGPRHPFCLYSSENEKACETCAGCLRKAKIEADAAAALDAAKPTGKSRGKPAP